MNVSLKINNKTITLFKKKYKNYKKDPTMPYAIFFAQKNDITITIFKSKKKDEYSLVITSKKESDINSVLKSVNLQTMKIDEPIKEIKLTNKKGFLFTNDQIGSDEVGTGDFFGPIIVAATLVKQTDLPYLKELGVQDSKKLTDEKIRLIAKSAIKKFKYSLLTLDNKKYNELIKKGFNMNKIKCYLHNQALSNLHKKYPEVKNIYLDQFESPKSYYKHLIDEKNVLRNIYFHTKGESYFPSVALASVIARYTFLVKMDELNKKYKTNIPFGASNQVNSFAKQFIKKYGITELNKICKMNFKNYQSLIS